MGICLICKFFNHKYKVYVNGPEFTKIVESRPDNLDNLAEEITECRRHAPCMLSGSGTGWSDQLFPKVSEDDWCGEFEKSK